MTEAQFQVERREKLPPDDEKAADIFSRLGYRIADALADLADNSVDAAASRIHVRFVRGTEGVQSVLIVDNGEGMNEDTLREAMRFGSRVSKSTKQLGKYGIGLKSASLSQAQTVTVLTKQGRSTHGRRWTVENVRQGWTCEILRESDVRKAFTPRYGEFQVGTSGTIVIWERLEHLKTLPNTVDRVLQRTIQELSTELGIRFHRFLEGKRLKISVDHQFGVEAPTAIPIYVTPLNPFSYEQSGSPGYPRDLQLSFDGAAVTAACHIWPAKSKSPGYRLGGGKVALRQGFYFYRNDRVIQAGGWNGVRADDGEPHLSLARVLIDLPPVLDSMFKLDVTKSRLDPSPNFINALQSSNTGGTTFAKYLEDADGAYRKKKQADRARFPFTPGVGMPVRAQKAIANVLAENDVRKQQKVKFTWTKLDLDEVFVVDPRRRTIHLNLRYKRHLVEGKTRDAPILKLLLMFLLQDELGKERATQKSMNWTQRVNQALLASLKE